MKTVVAMVALALVGCTPKSLPPRAHVIERVDLHGEEKIDADDVEARIATMPTKRILGGLLEGVPVIGIVDTLTVEYHAFDRFVLQRDLERVRRFYRARGFYDTLVRAGRVIPYEDGVRVEIVVDEGDPVLVERVDYDFPEQQRAFKANEKVYEVVSAYRDRKPEKGEPLPRFDEDLYDETKAQLGRALTDSGYAYGSVEGKVHVDLARRRATVRFSLSAGPHCEFGRVRIEGLGNIPERPVIAAIGITEGEPYSTSRLEEARYALADLQVFGSIEILPNLTGKKAQQRAGAKPKTRIDVTVRVQRIKLRGFKIGGGAEIGTQLDTHAVLGFEHKNFIGGLRRLSAEVRPGLVFFPTSADTLFSQAPTDVLPEAELLLSFTQPAFVEKRTNLKIQAGARMYAPQATPVPDPVPEGYNIVGYREVDGSLGFDRKLRFPYLGLSTVYLGQFIRVQLDDPFSYNLDEPPEGFLRVLVPYLETIASWDFRKGAQGEPNSVQPVKGVYFGLSAQFAGGFLLGDADDIRLQPEVRVYTSLSQKVVLALRWSTGFLFPRNYGQSFQESAPGARVEPRDLQLLSFRALYSGGPYSNRGYGYREVGPHAVLPYLSQRTATGELLPTGGLGMWELSGELRIALSEQIGGVLFIDSSDVVRALSDFRLTYPHISPGLGFRVYTPVGPLRFDLGIRIPYLQKIGSELAEPFEGGPDPATGDPLPLEPSIAIGEAF